MDTTTTGSDSHERDMYVLADTESDSADREREVLPEVEGNLESLVGRVLSGWARDVQQPESTLTLNAYCDNKLLGTANADDFRDDLMEAGIGDGCHGFQIELSEDILDGKAHTIDVIDADSRISLGSIDLELSYFAVSTINTIDSGTIHGAVVLAAAHAANGFDIDLLVDGQVAGSSVCHISEDKTLYRFAIAMPSKFFDDCHHVFTIQVTGYLTQAKPYMDLLPSVITPWKHISHDIKTSTLSSLSKVSGFRYKSLQRVLRRHEAAQGKCQEVSLADVMLAHDVVVEGYETRRLYPQLTLPHYTNPTVSIVIPVHNKFELTYHCIASLILNAGDTSFEVIVVDDLSSDKTVDIEQYINHVKVVKNVKNLGFLQSAQAGADQAIGDYVLFLNNDTEVTPDWLESMMATFDTFTHVGMTGSKLIYPTGKLQEAGGIIWNNGHPWNVGNRQNASHPLYNYTRSADYLSGAAMMLPIAVWKEVNGLSKEYIPAYYEDVDLAFKVREAGYKTLYCPSSTVIHFEGMSNGTELNAGIKKFQSLNAPKFRRNWRHQYKRNASEGQTLEKELDRDCDFRVLVVDHSTPRPNIDAGGYAVTQEIMLMQELGCKVTFAPNNMAYLGSYTQSLQDAGVECIYAPYYTSVGDYLAERGYDYDLVYIIRYDVAEQIIPSIRQYSNAKIVLNNCDLHFLREIRAALSEGHNNIAGPLKTRDRELAVMKDVDAVMSYNDVEHSVITSHNGGDSNVFKCPWILEKKRSTVPFDKRDGIAFLGGFNHTPNAEGIRYFVDSVMPELTAAAPDIKLHIYGSNMPPEIEDMATDNIIVHGYVESLSTVFDSCRVFIAPLLSGAGIKGKVLESIAYGIPSVLSPVAAESTGLTHGNSAFIANSDSEWVNSIIDLYNDESLWQRTADATQTLMSSDYDFNSGLKKMTTLFEHLELEPANNLTRLFRRNETEVLETTKLKHYAQAS